MSWRDRLMWADDSDQQGKKARFRDAYFFVRDVEADIGRRNVVHQYPFRDDPYVEDLGRDAEMFIIHGYVVQNTNNNQDYIDERDELIYALQQSGPGILVHPFYGEMLVSLVGKARIQETFREGGIAYFTMTFVKVKDVQGLPSSVFTVPQPKSVADHQESVDIAAEASLNRASDGFNEGYDPEDMPGFTSNSVMTTVNSLNSMLRSVQRSIQAAFPAQVSKAITYLANTYAGIDTTKIIETCDLAASIGNMFNGLKSILGMYGDLLSDQLLGSCSGIVYGYYSGPMSGAKVLSTGIPGGTQLTGFADSTIEKSSYLNESLGKTAIRAILAMNRFGESRGESSPSPHGGALDDITINTYQRARQSANIVSIVNLVRVNVIIVAVRGAVRIKYTSYNSAIDIMDEVVEEIDDLLLKLGNDSSDMNYDSYDVTVSSPESYTAVESLRPIFVEAMKGIGATLPRPVEYEVPPDTISALALAYEKYYDLDREAEIIERNIPLVKHPGFLPSGRTIEVLNE